MDETLGQRIKRLRTNKKLSQVQLAERLGVSKSAISFYESDTREPPYDTLIRMADIFRVTVEYLLGISREQAMTIWGLTRDEEVFLNITVDFIKKHRNQ